MRWRWGHLPNTSVKLNQRHKASTQLLLLHESWVQLFVFRGDFCTHYNANEVKEKLLGRSDFDFDFVST